MTNPKVLLLSVNYLGIVTASLGLLLFVPQIIKSLGATNMGTGYATSLAYVCGAISMIDLGLDLRPDGRSALAAVLHLHPSHRRPGDRRRDDGHLVVAGRACASRRPGSTAPRVRSGRCRR